MKEKNLSCWESNHDFVVSIPFLVTVLTCAILTFLEVCYELFLLELGTALPS